MWDGVGHRVAGRCGDKDGALTGREARARVPDAVCTAVGDEGYDYSWGEGRPSPPEPPRAPT